MQSVVKKKYETDVSFCHMRNVFFTSFPIFKTATKNADSTFI